MLLGKPLPLERAKTKLCGSTILGRMQTPQLLKHVILVVLPGMIQPLLECGPLSHRLARVRNGDYSWFVHTALLQQPLPSASIVLVATSV